MLKYTHIDTSKLDLVVKKLSLRRQFKLFVSVRSTFITEFHTAITL
jgi:hypothetical protein